MSFFDPDLNPRDKMKIPKLDILDKLNIICLFYEMYTEFQ